MKKTEVLKADKKSISRGARLLKRGCLVAFPTETVYGLGANLLDKRAVDRLYRVKRRPKDKPFTVLIADSETIEKMGCAVTEEAKRLTDEFWPGPLTVILKGKGNRKIGFRMPDNRIARSLVRQAGVPVACPSANVSGSSAPRDAKGVLQGLEDKIDLLIDGGKTDIGVESTVVDLTVRPPKILREGAITRGKLKKVLAHRS